MKIYKCKKCKSLYKLLIDPPKEHSYCPFCGADTYVWVHKVTRRDIQ